MLKVTIENHLFHPTPSINTYFGLCQGPFDYRLKWPFEGAITISCRKKLSTQPNILEFPSCETRPMNPNNNNHGIGSRFLDSDEFKDYVLHDKLNIEVTVSSTETHVPATKVDFAIL